MSALAPDAPGQYGGEWHDRHDHRWHKTDLAAQTGGTVSASRTVIAGDVCEFHGYAIRETTGAGAATLRLRDGNAVGELLLPLSLAAGEADQQHISPHGVAVETGKIFLELIAGSVEGVIYWR